MGKASSSKKVARAARAGGTMRERPKLGFPLAIAAIVVVGTVLVVYARADRVEAAQSKEAPIVDKDHWHSAYGIYVCDTWLPPLPETAADADTNGIHTHADGVMHVQPETAEVSGRNATLGEWAKTSGLTLGEDSFAVNGVTYADGFDCNGTPANVYVYRWADAFDPTSPAEVFDAGFPAIRFRDDRSAFVFAVVPEGTDVPRPESIPKLNDLADLPDAGAASGTAGAATGGLTDPTGGATVSTLPITPSDAGATGGATPSVSDVPAVSDAPAGGTPGSTP